MSAVCGLMSYISTLGHKGDIRPQTGRLKVTLLCLYMMHKCSSGKLYRHNFVKCIKFESLNLNFTFAIPGLFTTPCLLQSAIRYKIYCQYEPGLCQYGSLMLPPCITQALANVRLELDLIGIRPRLSTAPGVVVVPYTAMLQLYCSVHLLAV